MQTNDKVTTDNAHSSQEAPAQQKQGSLAGIKDKIGGVVNVVHGTGEVIRGQTLQAGTFGHGHGNGKDISAAGREEIERGLNRIEGRQTATSATGHDQEGRVGDSTGVAPGRDTNTNTPQAERGFNRNEGRQAATTATGHDQKRGFGDSNGVAPGHDPNSNIPQAERGSDINGGRQAATTGHDHERGVGDGTGVAPGHDLSTNTQAQTTVASRADPTSGKDRDVANTSFIADRGNPGTAENGPLGPSPVQQHHGEQTAASAPPRDPPSAGDGPGVQPNTGVRQQGNVAAPSYPGTGRETRATADDSYPADVAGQKQPFGTASEPQA